jgi:hypothetical protein
MTAHTRDDTPRGRASHSCLIQRRPVRVDFQIGWCVGNLGWNPPEIVARVQRFAGPSYITPSNTYAPWADLAERLGAIAPGELGASLCTKTFGNVAVHTGQRRNNALFLDACVVSDVRECVLSS